ncbi:MAG: TonB-dependent receptor [Xanthomonadales bacterium]|nr:TonB-dependent receptor [Xanthomonadales bacterium]
MKIPAYLQAAALAVAPFLSPAEETRTADLERMVVTAARVPLEPGRVTQSVTVITREDIERRQAVRVVDLLRDVPGVAVSQSGPVGSQTQVRMRGSEANHVLVMIDGVDANDPASSDDFRFEHLMTADVQRIEIVRGPQSALWGTDALAGVINIITRSGGETGGSVFVEMGSNDTRHAGASLEFGNSRLQGHLGAARFDTDGTNVARTGNERDGTTNTTLTTGLRAELGEQATLDAMVRYVDATSDIDAIDFLATGLPVDANLQNTARRGYGRLRGTWDDRNNHLNHQLTVSYLDTQTENRGSTTDSAAAERIGLRYQVTWVPVTDHLVTAAVDHERTDFAQRGTASPFGDPNQDQRMDQTGLVVDYVGQSGPRWDYNLSTRYDDHSDFEDAVTVRAAVGYRVGEQGRLRATAGTGRKAPTFTERYGFFADQFIGNPDLEPEESRSLELGYERDFENGAIGVALFDQDLEQEINGFIFDPTSGLFTARNQEGRSHRRGVELIASWQPSRSWSVSGNYTFTDATELEGSAEVDEIRRPRHAASLNFNYATDDGRGNLNLNVNYNGRRDDTFFPPFPEPPTRVQLDDVLLVDLAARWSLNERLELFGRIANLFDEQYEEVYGFATPGRTAMAGLRYRFGP